MLVSFFKTNHPFSILAILPILLVLLWLPGVFAFPYPLAYENTMPLYDAIVFLFLEIPYAASVASLILIYVQAIMINRIVNNNEMLKPRTNLPAFMYVILMSCVVELQTLHPVVLSNLFIIFALSRISTVYLQKTVFSQAFDSAMLVALASFFYFPAIAFFIFIWGSLLIIRPFIWREYVIALFGLILPYLFLGTWYFWTGELKSFFGEKITSDFNPAEIVIPELVAADYALMLFLLVLLGFSILTMFKIMGKNVVRVQYLLRSMIALLTGGVVAFLFDASRNLHTIALAAIPSSVFIANYLLLMKKRWISELILFVLLFLIIYNFFTGPVK